MEDNEQVKTTHIIINCDGYYPECGNCGYWLERYDEICPQCGLIVNWEDRR